MLVLIFFFFIEFDSPGRSKIQMGSWKILQGRWEITKHKFVFTGCRNRRGKPHTNVYGKPPLWAFWRGWTTTHHFSTRDYEDNVLASRHRPIFIFHWVLSRLDSVRLIITPPGLYICVVSSSSPHLLHRPHFFNSPPIHSGSSASFLFHVIRERSLFPFFFLHVIAKFVIRCAGLRQWTSGNECSFVQLWR